MSPLYHQSFHQVSHKQCIFLKLWPWHRTVPIILSTDVPMEGAILNSFHNVLKTPPLFIQHCLIPPKQITQHVFISDPVFFATVRHHLQQADSPKRRCGGVKLGAQTPHRFKQNLGASLICTAKAKISSIATSTLPTPTHGNKCLGVSVGLRAPLQTTPCGLEGGKHPFWYPFKPSLMLKHQYPSLVLGRIRLFPRTDNQDTQLRHSRDIAILSYDYYYQVLLWMTSRARISPSTFYFTPVFRIPNLGKASGGLVPNALWYRKVSPFNASLIDVTGVNAACLIPSIYLSSTQNFPSLTFGSRVQVYECHHSIPHENHSRLRTPNDSGTFRAPVHHPLAPPALAGKRRLRWTPTNHLRDAVRLDVKKRITCRTHTRSNGRLTFVKLANQDAGSASSFWQKYCMVESCSWQLRSTRRLTNIFGALDINYLRFELVLMRQRAVPFRCRYSIGNNAAAQAPTTTHARGSKGSAVSHRTQLPTDPVAVFGGRMRFVKGSQTFRLQG
ncbi:uncharacterized protein BDR25DRAFT_361198 [Lindgomyces ingoldianus]|uniref:Uncharacterized protein n=1 Tax=Lindgomyces ingoldianus TaxID=673940 RepID=A0ACB6QEE0_9PLEO|nr:uncharacterized protein BDR25DRAFT_361198 [Lindgomyces ingoldianus]KAF2464978.1 hypothetical protein BDR25DRAFT_361198 [Lindgomyces ingoldianus]